MKKLLSLFVAMVIVTSCFAHYVNPSTDQNACSKSGYEKVVGSNFTFTGASLDSVYFFITKNGNANVSVSNPVLWDTSFLVTSSSFSFYIKLITSKENLLFKEYTRQTIHKSYSLEYENFDNTGNIYTFGGAGTINSICVIMPVTGLSTFNGSYNENQTGLTFSWTTTSEENNNYFVIEGSVDGKQWNDLEQVNSYWSGGNGSTAHSYFAFFGQHPIEAGISGAVGIVLIIVFLGSLLERKKKKSMKIPSVIVLLLSVFIFSCQKTNVVKQHSNYRYFQLKQVDLDGNASYSKVIYI